MPIYQTNIFICEVCEKVESTTTITDLYSEPNVVPPDGKWDYNKNDKLCCPDCLKINTP